MDALIFVTTQSLHGNTEKTRKPNLDVPSLISKPPETFQIVEGSHAHLDSGEKRLGPLIFTASQEKFTGQEVAAFATGIGTARLVRMLLTVEFQRCSPGYLPRHTDRGVCLCVGVCVCGCVWVWVWVWVWGVGVGVGCVWVRGCVCHNERKCQMNGKHDK